MLADKRTGRCDNAFGQLLTDTEHIMLAKRFAAIVMLAEGISTYRVRIILEISPTTACYLRDALEQGEYEHIVNIARRKKERESVFGTRWALYLKRICREEKVANGDGLMTFIRIIIKIAYG